MENDKTDYITEQTISSDRLQIAPFASWYYINDEGKPSKFKNLVKSIKNCGDNEICNVLYRI